MNLDPTMASASRFCCHFCFILIFNVLVFSADSAILYSDHCSSVVLQSKPSTRDDGKFELPSEFYTVHYYGGDGLFGKKRLNDSNYLLRRTGVRFRIDSYNTKAGGLYKLKASLNVRSSYRYYGTDGRKFTFDGSYRRRNISRGTTSLMFSLNGFWSESSRRLCMVGSTIRRTDEGKLINLDAVLKLNYASVKPNMFSSVISGTLESPNSMFEPISMFQFSPLPNYVYSSVSEEFGRGFNGGSEVPVNRSLKLDSGSFCSVLSGKYSFLDIEYGSDCKNHHNCSLLSGVDGFRPPIVLLNSIQCSEEERKLRCMIWLENDRYGAFDGTFDLNRTILGEGSWDDRSNQLFIVGCRILDPISHFGSSVGDCSLRLSLRFPLIWTIRSHAKIVGNLWTNRSADDLEYSKTKLSSIDDYDPGLLTELKYEYTEIGRVRKQCAVKKIKKKGNVYPDGKSDNMRFDISVKNSEGKTFSWGYVSPLSVGNELYQRERWVAMAPASAQAVDVGLPTTSEPASTASPLNMSFTISINEYQQDNSSINWSLNQGRITIIAEGEYYAETGHLCMVGCRKLLSYVGKPVKDSMDCEILVQIDFAPLNDKLGGLIKGNIRSTRAKKDILYFEDMSLASYAFYEGVAKQSLWRMDLEITMVLITNTLVCIFVGLQLFHLRRNPETASSISLLMLLILSLGYMIPLVLNFEALFLENHDKQTTMLSSGGWLEANEVAVRVVTMVAFLMLIRLLQLVWASKSRNGDQKGSWAGEKKVIFVSFPIYIIGGLLTLLKWKRDNHQAVNLHMDHQAHYLLGYLRSYAGLILDGFLMPQILFNSFSGSSVQALSHTFYMGTSAVRLVPHAYDQYRAHNFPASHVNGTYYYANPSADFYSTAWDVIIPCGVIALTVIIFLQQKHGGRCILPKRFRELELYEKVPVGDDQQ